MDAFTTTSQTRAEQCKKNAQAKSARKRQETLDAIACLRQEGKPITKAAVAKRAGVSVVFLRTHNDLLQTIEEAEQVGKHQALDKSPSDKAKDQVIAALRR